MAKYCDNCGEQILALTGIKTLDGRLCNRCAQISIMAKSLNTMDIRKLWALSDRRKGVFSPQVFECFCVDYKNRLLSISNSPIHRFEELISYEFEEIQPTYETRTRGGFTRGIVGGVVAGPVGALIGSGTAKKTTIAKGGGRRLHIYFSSFGQTQTYSIDNPKDGMVGLLDKILSEKQNNKEEPMDLSKNAETLLKFKQLLDEGIITQEEFEQKKKALLIENDAQSIKEETIATIKEEELTVVKPKKKPVYKKWWFWLVMLWVLGAFIGMIVGIAGSDSDSSDTSENQKEVEEEVVDTNIYIGEQVKNNSNVYYKVTNVQNTNKIGYNSTSNNYVVVTIQIYNARNSSWNQNPLNCKLIKGSQEYEYNSATFYLDYGMTGLTEINPGISKTMQIAFETPTTTLQDEYKIELSDYGIWLDDSVTIVLKSRA